MYVGRGGLGVTVELEPLSGGVHSSTGGPGQAKTIILIKK